MKHTKKILSVILTCSVLLSGCAKKGVEAPLLLEPAETNESYRPVEYGDIGKKDVTFATVVPTDYCHFWTSGVTISRIEADIGDYVNEGDIIAYADTEDAYEKLSDYNAELDLENSVFAVNETLYQLKREELTLKGQSTEAAVLDENHRYDTMLHEYRVNNLNQYISEQQEIIDDATLRARASGYVTYIKDISAGETAAALENVVIVSDYNDCYLELNDIIVSEEYRTNNLPYDTYYTEISGVKYELYEYEYLPDELILIENKEQYPNMRMKFKDDSVKLTCGDSIPVFMTGDLTDNVLIVGNDSLYNDTGGDFVYVENGDTKEKRYVSLGEKGEWYTEVVSGLSEGEMVYYTTTVPVFTDYDSKEVNTSDFSPVLSTESYTIEDTKTKAYYSEYEGIVETISAEEGKAVNEGDLICTVRTNEGSAALLELSNSIAALKKNYDSACADYANKIAELQNQMAALTEPSADTATATDADAENADTADPNLYKELELEIEQVKAEEQISTLNYNYQLADKQEQYKKISCDNDGSGVICIYADTGGTISDINIKEGEAVTMGDRMFNIDTPAADKAGIRCQGLRLNQGVEFYDETTDKTYTGHISGYSGNADKAYVTSIDGKAYITTNIVSSGIEMFYVELDDHAFFDNEEHMTVNYTTISVKNVFDAEWAVNTGYDSKTEENYYYVWKVVSDRLVLQYVTIATDELSGESCIISGIKDGDRLAWQVTDSEGGADD